MDELEIKIGSWEQADSVAASDAVCRTAFSLFVGTRNLTKNENLWTRAVESNVVLSVHPLAEWFLQSWWRLLWEPEPDTEAPEAEWRMAHELASAGGGFVWPHVRFVSDRESMRVTARLTRDPDPQSVRYIEYLDDSRVGLDAFQAEVMRFVETIVARVEETGCESSVPDLWRQLQDEIADPEAATWRRLEAELGFDPDEAPESEVEAAGLVAERLGAQTASELIPAFGQGQHSAGVKRCHELMAETGIAGRPDFVSDVSNALPSLAPPWKQGIVSASHLRSRLADPDAKLETAALCNLLGISAKGFEAFRPPPGVPVGMAIADESSAYIFHPRKRGREDSRRYELARFVGDLSFVADTEASSLASTDFRTARQAFQRAFAAELLCPAEGVRNVTAGYDGEEAEEVAAEHFGVSGYVVRHQRMNTR